MKSRLLFLFIVLIFWIAMSPALTQTNPAEAFFFMILLLSMLYFDHSDENKVHTYTSLIIGLLLVVTAVINVFARLDSLSLLTFLLSVTFFVNRIYMIVRYIITLNEITLDAVIGVISVYLLLGLSWVSLYRISLLFDRSSFGQKMEYGDLLYYSFVCITTLGDGKFKPASIAANSLTILEAITGVLYIATVIALIVGTYSASVMARRIGK